LSEWVKSLKPIDGKNDKIVEYMSGLTRSSCSSSLLFEGVRDPLNCDIFLDNGRSFEVYLRKGKHIPLGQYQALMGRRNGKRFLVREEDFESRVLKKRLETSLDE